MFLACRCVIFGISTCLRSASKRCACNEMFSHSLVFINLMPESTYSYGIQSCETFSLCVIIEAIFLVLFA